MHKWRDIQENRQTEFINNFERSRKILENLRANTANRNKFTPLFWNNPVYYLKMTNAPQSSVKFIKIEQNDKT